MMILALSACTVPVTPDGRVPPASEGILAPDVIPPPTDSDAETGRDTQTHTAADTTDTGEEESPPRDPAILPVLLINTDGVGIPSDRKIPGTIAVVEDHTADLSNLLSEHQTWAGPIGIQTHGSSTSGYPKTSYRFECQDRLGADMDCPLAGMEWGRDWVLRAEYCDHSLMRDALAFWLARGAAANGGISWQPDTRFVEVFLNGGYEGVYTLVERVQKDGTRIDVPSWEEDRGFIVRVDQHRGAGFDTAMGTPIDWVDPRAEEVTDAQRSGIRAVFNDFETSLRADGWDDPSTGYPTRIAVADWVDHYLVNEAAHNIDAYRLSAHLWYGGDTEGLLHAAPVWDFDRSFGNVNYCDTERVNGWTIDDLTRCGYGGEYPFWWPQLVAEPAFQAALSDRWGELRASLWSDAAIDAQLDAWTIQLALAQPREDHRWHTVGTYIDPNSYVGATWQEDVDWLREWMRARAGWLDTQWGD